MLKYRCINKHHSSWKHYGGRGIEFRFSSFAEFFAELGPRPKGLTLDRIDNDGHYEVGNVRWVTRTKSLDEPESYASNASTFFIYWSYRRRFCYRISSLYSFVAVL